MWHRKLVSPFVSMISISWKIIITLWIMMGWGLAQGLDKLAAPDITVTERNQRLDDLQSIEKVVLDQRQDLYSEAFKVLTEALGDDKKLMDLYQKCCLTLGQTAQGQPMGKLMAFNRNIKEVVGKHDMIRALRIQVEYLLISLRASQAEADHEMYSLFAELIRFMDKAIELDEELGSNRHVRFMYNPVTQSVFARALKLNGSLKVGRPWHWKPMDVRGIYENCIIPALRHADTLPMLQMAWQSRLKHENILAERRASEKDREQNVFEKIEVPRLYWKRAQDFYMAGDQRKALDEMLRVIKENRFHPNSQDWISFLRGLLNKSE